MLQLSSTVINYQAPFDHSLDGGHVPPPTVPDKALYGLLWSSSKTKKTSWNIRSSCRDDTFKNYLLRLVYPLADYKYILQHYVEQISGPSDL